MTLKGKSGKRFANKRYELVINYPSTFPLNPLNQVTLTINGYIPRSFELSDKCTFQNKGDVLGEVPLGEFKLEMPYEFVNKKLKFVATSFWVTLSGYTQEGPLSFKKLKLFGIGERSG